MFRRLGLRFDAPDEDVRDAHAYLLLEAKLDQEKTRRIEEAFRVLSNSAERELYVMTHRALRQRGFEWQDASPAPRWSKATRILNKIYDHFCD